MGYSDYIKARYKYIDWDYSYYTGKLDPKLKVEQRRYQRRVDKQEWKKFINDELAYLDTELWRAQPFDKDGDLVIDSDGFGRWWLEPRQVDVVASTGGKALENAADEGTTIDVDKLIRAIKNYGWTVNETIAYLEGFKGGVNTL